MRRGGEKPIPTGECAFEFASLELELANGCGHVGKFLGAESANLMTRTATTVGTTKILPSSLMVKPTKSAPRIMRTRVRASGGKRR